MCSVGPILAVLLLSIISGGDISAPSIEDYLFAENINYENKDSFIIVFYDNFVLLGIL